MLDAIRCPFCWGAFQQSHTQTGMGQLRYGLLQCHCGTYPVVAGIPILQKNPASVLLQIISRIQSGDLLRALTLAVSPLSLAPPQSPGLAPTWAQGLPSVKGLNRVKHLLHTKGLRKWEDQSAELLSQNGHSTAFSLNGFFFSNQKEAFNYFAFRFGQPRYLVALSFATIIQDPGKPILDLACGQGHITRYLLRRARGQAVVGMDPNFLGLYLAKTIIAPEAEFICAATDGPLPFSDGFFGTAFCSDAFHYFTNKAATVRELRRLVQDDGLIILTWMHNVLFRMPHDGSPLPHEGYASLVADQPHRLVADNEVLARYHQKKGPALARQAEGETLAKAPLLSIVASARQDVFRDYDTFREWPHAEGRLQINPLYQMEKNAGSAVQLRLNFPSDFYLNDNLQYRNYLPETVAIDEPLLQALGTGTRTPAMAPLVDQCVLLDIPDRYQ